MTVSFSLKFVRHDSVVFITVIGKIQDLNIVVKEIKPLI